MNNSKNSDEFTEKTYNDYKTIKFEGYNQYVKGKISVKNIKLKYIIHLRSEKMQITDIKVRKLFDEGPMKAIVSVTFDGQLAVHDIKVINARDKFFIVMPSRKNPDDTYRDIVHPINSAFRGMLEEQIISAYEDALLHIDEYETEAVVSE